MPDPRSTGPRWWSRLRAGQAAGRGADQEIRVIPWGARHPPRSVVVKAGRPIRLVFERPDGERADESVAIPSLGWVTTLGCAARVSVELRPCRAGAYAFTSVDGALRGCLVVEP